ncbi:pentatricopeptide repeat-containing protein At2g13600-like isoform X1 [Salvia splendens]|uniref:pentatricopeptide repeat-containing protein At2g13600-like isoform X1 n=1 Tax=Salvia splendens TaxID=180675 RepID=UPI001C2765E9|nr:pentatricopeptide repeat-containing protein At2g13600-like isoform X1 [Salvia splendens]XP_042051190.1 pentatricopeptide repeat-containing protein At2g13600-like isoform X1 [Salvia splendens]
MAAMRAAPTAAMLARSIFRPPLHAQVSARFFRASPSPGGFTLLRWRAPTGYCALRCSSSKSGGQDKKSPARLVEVQRLLDEAEERYKAAGGGAEPIPQITLDEIPSNYPSRNGMGRNYSVYVNKLSLTHSSSFFAKLLETCTKSKSARDVCATHACVLKSQFSDEVFINNRLIDVYGKCGCLKYAQKLFGNMTTRNAFSYNSIIGALVASGSIVEAERVFIAMPESDQCSWNLMISGFAQLEVFDRSLEHFAKMHYENFVLNEYSYGSALSACAGLRDVVMGTQIHGSLAKSRFLSDVYMGSALVDMYAKCGDVDCAEKAFLGIRERNIVSWNSMITCYEQNGPANEALEVFRKMMECGVQPDEMTLASVVSACASLSALKEGLEIHARVVKYDKLCNDLVISNALVDMYAKCRKIKEARWIFDRMPIRNVVSETSIISGYAKAASVEAARSVFSKMMERNVVSWNALIAGYTQNGDNEEALRLFLLLKREAMWPTHYTFGNLLNACANLADLKLGRQSHSHVLKQGLRFQHGLESDVFVGNSLIDMYMKCGSVEDGSKVFNTMIERDVVSFNAMIVGFAQNGQGGEALELFRQMLECGEDPDDVTMIGVLCACSHAGLVEEGRHYFHSMRKEYSLEPKKDHYTCMVDLLGRAGILIEAKNLILSMPIPPDGVVWGSLLASCKVHHNVELGNFVAEKLIEIDPQNSGPYVLLSNMYAEVGKWRDVTRVRKLMRCHGVVKQPGCSWIEIGSHVHVFMAKDSRHSQKREIYSLLRILAKMMKMKGYAPNVTDFLC